MSIEDLSQLTVSFTKGNLVKVQIEENGIKKNKTITFDEFCKIINTSNSVDAIDGRNYKDIYTRTGLLPHTGSDSVKCIECKISETSNTKVYILLRKPKSIDLTYYEDKFENIPMPTLLFAIKVVNDVIVSCNVVATKSESINDRTLVYRYPFANVFADTKICFGNNSIQKLDASKPEHLTRIVNMFLYMPNNDHNYSQCNNSGLPPRKYFNKLKELDKFPNDYLVNVYGAETYSNWIIKL